MNEVSLHRQRYSELPTSLPPRGLSRLQVAEYVGVSASTFDKMVSDGDMPAPKRIRGASFGI
jgi:excisionase family DNA binding protein